jgi:hypothetical protein
VEDGARDNSRSGHFQEPQGKRTPRGAAAVAVGQFKKPLDFCPKHMNIIRTMNTQSKSKFPEPPGSDIVLQQLRPLLDVTRDAIQEGVLHVSEYFTWQAEPIDFALAPNLVRHKAKRFLISRGQDARDETEETPDFETEDIPNNGICTSVPGYRVRVLKSSDDGGVPLPGVSMTRRNFYNQLQALLDFGESTNGRSGVQPTWGLVVHWTVNQRYDLLQLSVALPLRVTKNDLGKTVVKCAFDEPFWTRPSETNVVEIGGPIAPTDLNLSNIEQEPDEKTGEEPRGE